MLRWVLALFGAALSVVGAILVIYSSWKIAAPTPDSSRSRLVWYVSVNRPIRAGTVVTSTDLRQQLGRLPEQTDYVRTIASATARFATRDISVDMPLTKEMLAHLTAGEVPMGGVVVPVEVATDHISALVPGIELAFAKGQEMVPSAADLAKKNREPAFRLLAIAPSPRSPDKTSLIVAVPKCRLTLAGRIGSDSWRPVILKGHVPRAAS